MPIDIEKARQILALPEFEAHSKQLRDALGDDWPDADVSGLTAVEGEEFGKLVGEAGSSFANKDLADWIEKFLEKRKGGTAQPAYQQASPSPVQGNQPPAANPTPQSQAANPVAPSPIYQGSAITRSLIGGIAQHILNGIEVFQAGEVGKSSEYYYDRAGNSYDVLGNPLTASQPSAPAATGQSVAAEQPKLAEGTTGIYIDSGSRLFLRDSTEVWESGGLYYDRQGRWWDRDGQQVTSGAQQVVSDERQAMSGGRQAAPGDQEPEPAAVDVDSIMDEVIAENPSFAEISEERRAEIARMALEDLG